MTILEAAENLKHTLKKEFGINCTVEEARDAMIASYLQTLDMYPDE